MFQTQHAVANLGRHRQGDPVGQPPGKAGRARHVAVGAMAVILQVFHQRVESGMAVEVASQRRAQTADRLEARRHPASAGAQMLPNLLVQKAVDDDCGKVQPLGAHLLNQGARLAQALIFSRGYQHEGDAARMQQRLGFAEALDHAVHGLLGRGEEVGNGGKHGGPGEALQFPHHEARRAAGQAHRKASRGKVRSEQPSRGPRVQ
ncbi:MAG TPA: hypothetical protein VFE56_12045 [Candidatus Binataceae bacterium]|nr:hypothetical protein [Candidatus Binataceae bacterium]